MKIRVVSDLHLEMGRFKNGKEVGEHYRLSELPDDSETILLLPGDIGMFNKPHTIVPFIEDVCSRFAHVIHVAGNHEYYKGNLTRSLLKFREAVQHTALHSLENDMVVIDDVVFLGATMWTDFHGDHAAMVRATGVMNDYVHIRIGDQSNPARRKIHPTDILSRHLSSKAFIEAETYNAQYVTERKCVVITHHAPCHLSIHENFRDSEDNAFYYSSLEDIMLDNHPVLWVHGHTHQNMDYEVNRTRVVCNPRGYVDYGEDNTEYDENLVIEI